MLTITVKGPPKSGKTTTAVKIATLFKSNGHRVKLIDCSDGMASHNFEGQFDDEDPEFQIVTDQEGMPKQSSRHIWGQE